MSAPLWQPSPQRIANANLTAFMREAHSRWGVPVEDYAALHRWSVAEPAQFWQSVWSFCGVIGDARDGPVLENADRMPGARWFPGARLNYAENLLRRRLPDAMVLRFAGIYGPGRLLRRQALEKGEPVIGDPDKWLNLIHVEDGAAAVAAAVQVGTGGRVVNVCDDRPARRREFYGRLAELLGAPPPRFEPPAPGAAVPHERANRRIVNRRMHSELHVRLRYPSFEEGLPAALSAP